MKKDGNTETIDGAAGWMPTSTQVAVRWPARAGRTRDAAMHVLQNESEESTAGNLSRNP